MKTALIFAVLIAVALAAPPPAAPSSSDKDTVIQKLESDVGIDGYKFAYETSDGVAREESAQLKNIAPDVDALQVQGTVSWTAPDGQKFTVRYVADENGFQPQGDHLPVAPVA